MAGGASSLPLFSALVSLAATGYLLNQYLKTKSTIKLAFAASMVLMLVGQALEYAAGTVGWTTGTYKLYYFTSPLSPAVMGVGALMLLADRKWHKYLASYVAIVSLVLLFMVATAPVDEAKFALGPFIGGEAMPRNVRMLSPLFTVPGSIAMLVGSLYSFAKDRTKFANLMVAAGAVVFALGGAVLRMGAAEAFLALELFGTLVLAYAFAYSEPVTTKA